MSHSAVLFAAFFAATRLIAAEAPASAGALARILTPEEFARAGLHKLSATELAALAAALQSHQQLPAVAPAAVPARESRPAKAAAPATKVVKSQDKAAGEFGAEQVVVTKPGDLDAELHSRIEGSLDGFSGRTVFVLENGQIWQQRNPETVSFSRKLVNPEVVITLGVMGYKMLIVPADRVVFVKRVQ